MTLQRVHGKTLALYQALTAVSILMVPSFCFLFHHGKCFDRFHGPSSRIISYNKYRSVGTKQALHVYLKEWNRLWRRWECGRKGETLFVAKDNWNVSRLIEQWTGETRSNGTETCPGAILFIVIPHRLALNWTRSCAVRGETVGDWKGL